MVDVSPLHRAVLSRNLVDVKQLVSAGAAINVANKADGRTPLHLAVAFADESIVDELLHHGADPRRGDNAGLTPLHVAVWGDKWNLMPKLLKHGADPNAVDARGTTPLTIAVANADPEVAEFVSAMLKAGGDPDFHPPGRKSARECIVEIAGGIGNDFPMYRVVMGWPPRGP